VGNAQVVLAWTAPTGVIAQAPITDYSVQLSTNGGSTWTTASDAVSTATSATITGLTNGTAYVFRVAAVNGVGTGAYTAASSSVTPIAGTPPNAPTSLAATAGNAQIALSWTAPSAPGTYAISGYTVEYTPSGGSAQTVSTGSTGTSYTLTGLTNATAYTVRVAGVSAAGTGTYTAASSSVTPTAANPFTSTLISGATSWSGSGTAASKLTPSSVFSAAKLVTGISGTLRVTGTANDGFDGYWRAIRKNGGANLINSTAANYTINVTISVSAGDEITFASSGANSEPFYPSAGDTMFGPSRSGASDVRVWIE
jgi:predicted phage tail protein